MKYTTTAAISLLLAALPCTAAEFFLKNGDKVVMMGDSITEQHLYSTYVEAWALTRFPAWDLEFFNVGIGGDNATWGAERFKRDVVGCGATAMTVNFGMNDCGGPGSNFDDPRYSGVNKIKEFMTSMQKIAEQAKAANIRVAWCTTTPAEVMDEGPSVLPYILNLEKFSGAVREIAATNGNALFIDQFHPFVAAIDKARAADPKTRIGGGDVVHPGQPGQTLMAAEILKGMSFPTLVAAVEINAASRKVVQNKNCQIEGLKVAAGRIEFQQQDNALPYFPDGDAKNILQWVPLLEQMNAYHLKVSGLKPGQYEVRLGGVKVAEYSAAQLGAGVNLAAPALTAGPVADQVKAVAAAISAKNSYFHDRIFCEVLRGGHVPAFMEMKREQVEAKRMEVFNERMKKMPELFAAIQKVLVMQAHQVEIVEVK
ncbi:MAG: GDSL-type esterase/lipase family protein [Verrucomicrobia bacterium]|nr:GDSL-type esterase/lipase family protein [Verrucomicrobiota bacterium]